MVLKNRPGYVARVTEGYKCVPKTGKKRTKEQEVIKIKNSKLFAVKGILIAPAVQSLSPNKVLFIEELPNVTTESLIQLFQKYPGFKEVRYFAPKKCAFVEFEDEFHSGIALNTLRGYKLTPEYSMKINYAKS